jgi:uncharacterized membrane protein
MSEESKPSQQELFDREWEDRANWKLGLFYYAPRDPRAWVPKRSSFGRRRFGVTPNLAHPQARAYFFITLFAFGGLFVLLYVLQWLGVIE